MSRHPTTEMPLMAPGTVVHRRYEIHRVISRPSGWALYDAIDLHQGRDVVLKVLHSAHVDPMKVERFRHELSMASEFVHPNIVRVWETGTLDGGRPFMAMERLSGETLHVRRARLSVLPVNECVDVLTEVLRALAVVHGKSVLHRDIKPHNILLTDRGAVLIDFGLGLRLDAPRRTLPGIAVGTPYYMAPEQVRGVELSPGTDLYCLAATIYEALTGVRTVHVTAARLGREPTVDDVFGAVIHGQVAPPSSIQPSVPRELDEILMRALHKSSAERFASASEMLDACDVLVGVA